MVHRPIALNPNDERAADANQLGGMACEAGIAFKSVPGGQAKHQQDDDYQREDWVAAHPTFRLDQPRDLAIKTRLASVLASRALSVPSISSSTQRRPQCWRVD